MSRTLTSRRRLAAAVLFGTLGGLGALGVSAAPAGAQSSVTVNFNALNATDGTGVVFTNNCYTESGFTFMAAGLACGTANTFAAYGPDANVATGPALTLNDPTASYVDITRAGGGAFSLSSLSLAAFDYSTTNVSLMGTLLGGGTMTDACPTLPGTAFATTFSSCNLTQFAGMSFTSLRLSSTNANGEPYVFMDDLVFTTAGTGGPGTTVPEPTTVVLLGGGLLAVGAAARRRRNA